jgi:hypothetical protein
MKLLLVIFVVLVVLMFLSPSPDTPRETTVTGLPWQIEVMPDGGSRVFGLTIGAATLADARTRFGDDGEIAIVMAPGESGSLENYFEHATLGAVTGKLILTAELSPEALSEMRGRAVKSAYMQSSTRKFKLASEDNTAALAARIRAIAFIPSINLDEAMIVQRFGQPVERIRSAERTEHFLYPERGLDILLDADAKELLQYVAPRDFARLREPLKPQGARP